MAKAMMTSDDFRTWLRRLKLTQKQAPEALGMTTRQVERYLAGTTPIPRTTELGFWRSSRRCVPAKGRSNESCAPH
jgi:hypothetical protein